MGQQFEPIAIVGSGCVVPGCSTAAELWETVAAGRCQLAHAPAGDWRVGIDEALGGEQGRYRADGDLSDVGGYVQGFDEIFDPASTALDPTLVARLDPVFRWSLHAAGQALAGVSTATPRGERAGVILGNLSYPTRAHNLLAEQEWFRRLIGESLLPGADVHAWNRFMSGLPAMVVGQAYGLGGGSLALDAACASGLYAIKLACDRLQDGRADLMLAGAVNAADQLFLHLGFSALNALSRSGRSRPFHAEADGLVPAEGAAFVALKRLDDALAGGDRILGVIRGVGLSNDGRSGGFLSPSQAGQVRSMRDALVQAGLSADEIQYVECHATGTTVGDATEIASLAEVYGHRDDLALGSLKANLGHLITASGVAGLIKVLEAMAHESIPATPGSRPLMGALSDSGFHVPEAAMPWPERGGQRTAAVSSFGFGGNNAHLIVQQYAPEPATRAGTAKLPEDNEFAVVGLAIRTHLDRNSQAFAARLLGEGSPEDVGDLDSITLSARQLAFPPADLKEALGQQLILMDLVREATRPVSGMVPERTGVYVGMQTDSEICRYSLRWRWPALLRQAGVAVDGERLGALREAVSRPLSSAGVIGKMPNVCANRLNNQLDIQGPGFAVSREELSGDAALELACTALRRGEIDVALVAAVDLCREEVHQQVAREVLGANGDRAADAAVMLVIKSRARAEKDGDSILAILAPGDASVAPTLSNDPAGSPIHAALGHAHAASGLLHVALAVQMLESGRRIAADGSVQPLLPDDGHRQVAVGNRSFTGETAHWLLREASPAREIGLASPPIPQIRTYAAADPKALAERVRLDQPGEDGPCRLAIVAEPGQLEGLRVKARQFLAADGMGDSWSLEGISFRRRPLQGELAFAFTGAAAAYPGMGRDLLLGMPRLTEGLARRLRNLDAAGGWAYQSDDPRANQPFYQLAGSSFLCQLHTEFSRRVLGLRPAVSLGLSSGETNGMFAFGVWQDFDALFTDIEQSGLYSAALANTFDAVRAHWGLPSDAAVDWENYRLRAPVDAVRAALAGIGRVYLTIINSPTDCVVGGDRAACDQLLAALGNPPAVPLGHDLAIHCEAVLPFEPAWRRLHTRTTTPVDGVRFYSNYFGGQFIPTREAVADALTGQALQTIDFPKIVNLAWEEGARIFVEHGPRNGLTTAIDEILEDREHLAVPLDRSGIPALVQAYRAAAQLWCAGVEVDLAGLQAAAPSLHQAVEPREDGVPAIAFRLRPPTPVIPKAVAQKPARLPAESTGDIYVPPPLRAGEPSGRLLPPAPALAALVPRSLPAPARRPVDPPLAKPASPPPAVSSPAPTPVPVQVHEGSGVLGLLLAGHRQLAEAHNVYLQAQGQAMQAFNQSMARIQAAMLGSPVAAPSLPAPVLSPLPATPAFIHAPSEVAVAPEPPPPAVVPLKAKRSYPGPAFSREDLEILAGGEISSIFGEAFKSQDHYPVQVRMPQPPLLLCDRVLGIEGEHHSMGQGAIWTETDVHADSWYLHHGRMPGGIYIESGQADLLLISWLGIDELNRGERAYRLLGCDLVFRGDLPAPGDTLHYEIRVDGHARQGDVRLFFFHYDCYVGGELRLSVRNGQAGFFTREELHNSAGVIWSPETGAYTPDAIVSPAPVPSRKRRFTAAEVESYLAGDLVACFGEEFFWADTHTRSPCSAGGYRNFLGEVVDFDLAGGPAGRGYLRVETAVRGDEWFFDGHFKNDPCMPGTLMAEACLQAMAFYMVASGHTLHRDGWRFRPMAEVPYRFKCRGQVTPDSRQIVYELFVDEIVDGPLPVLYAHVLATVDGRKAFLCERLGLQLVPDWPLTSMPEYLVDKPDTRPLAKIGDFPLDYRSLIHCAWGQPSRAFGEGFSHYDGPRRSLRLPGPPYHFMTRITALHGQMGQMKPGARVTAIYDVPPDAWFFTENARPTMPNCVLMEVALQPCGWLAALTLDRGASEKEFLFRNLDGNSIQYREVTPADRTITTETELISVSRVGEMIIEKFALRCTVDGKDLLKAETVFGFFSPAAMVNQKGFAASPEDLVRLERASDLCIELAERPSRLFGGNARLPASKLLMIDRISGYWPQGGSEGKGAIRAEKDVNSRDWFFKAHFYQDPVQPGSLGVEAMLQTVQAFMLLSEMDAGIENPCFEPIGMDGETVWHYRGQVTPDKTRISVEFEAASAGRDERGAYVVGMARLWVDGLQIYQVPSLGMRIFPGKAPTGNGTPDGGAHAGQTVTRPWRLDLDSPRDAWLRDHCPTYTLPSLPLTYELELMASAAAEVFPGYCLQAIERADAKHWIACPEAVAEGLVLVEQKEEGQAEVVLQSKEQDGRLTVAATARLRFGLSWQAAALEPLEPLLDPVPIEMPYEVCGLFHGPALQLMRRLVRGSNGAWASLAPAGKELPAGLLNAGLLDAALHCIPHDDFRPWCPQVTLGMVAFPIRIENFRQFGSLLGDGEWNVHARFVRLESGRFPRTRLRIQQSDRVVATFELLEILLPMGRLGTASPMDLRAFMRDRRFVPGVALSEEMQGETRLRRQDVVSSDWLPGTLAEVYGVAAEGEELARQIALKEHSARELRLHPSQVRFDADGRCLNLPLNAWNISCSGGDDALMARSGPPAALDWEAIHRDWSARMTGEATFVRDLGVALIRAFVRRVVLADPLGYAALKGRPFLYLGNHQTGVESFLFLAIATSLTQMPAGAIAKHEHRQSWLGRIHHLAELGMGSRNTMRMLFFDRAQQADMLRILKEFGGNLARDPYSLLVHVDGTRSMVAGAPVRGVSSVLVDLALANDLPIVPVRFAGGIKLGANEEREEFPYALGQQDYYLGAAIEPEVLRALPYAERARFVAESINRLGPTQDADVPLAGLPGLAEAVAAAEAAGRNKVQAVLYAALRGFPGLDALTRSLLDDPAGGQGGDLAKQGLDLIGGGG